MEILITATRRRGGPGPLFKFSVCFRRRRRRFFCSVGPFARGHAASAAGTRTRRSKSNQRPSLSLSLAMRDEWWRDGGGGGGGSHRCRCVSRSVALEVLTTQTVLVTAVVVVFIIAGNARKKSPSQLVSCFSRNSSRCLIWESAEHHVYFLLPSYFRKPITAFKRKKKYQSLMNRSWLTNVPPRVKLLSLLYFLFFGGKN